MRRLFFYVILFFIAVTFVIAIKAASDPTLQSLMKRGSIVTCLKSVKVNEAQDEWKSVEATMRLTGDCQSKNNCEIWRCNGINNEIAEDKALIDICEKNPASRPICSRPGIIDQLKAKIKKSVEVKAGCQILTDFSPSLGGKALYGNINVTTNQKFVPHVDYKFYAKGEAGGEPSITPVITTGVADVTGVNNSQQIGEISNFQSIPTPTVPPGSNQDCTGITWDPYGRVFDAVSLEPMTNVEVVMIDNKTNKPAEQQFEDNFSFTNLSGVFNILVEKAGEYLLDVITPATHLFVANPVLNSNYSLIYSDIYYPGNVYTEKQGKPTHHDIPLKPLSTSYFQTEISIIPNSLNQIDLGKFIGYGGRTTFPKTFVCLIGETSGKLVGDCVNADKIGKFSLNIDKAVIPQEERLIIQLKKVDLTNKVFSPVGQAIYPVDNNGKKYGFEPILNYITGYVYGDDGTTISPLSKMTVKSVIDDQIFFSTTSDSNGYFFILPKDLPIFEYYLEFTDPTNKVTKLTTSEFVKKNQDYLDSEKINLMQGTKQNQKIINPTTGEINNIINNNNYQPKNNQATTSLQKSFNPTIIMVILIMILLVTVTVGLVVYIKKSKGL